MQVNGIEVADNPKPSMYSLQSGPLLFNGLHMYSLSSEILYILGKVMYILPLIDVSYPLGRKYGHLATTVVFPS